MLHQGQLPRAVPLELPVDLRDRDVALVDHRQEVLREEVQQGVRRLARRAPVEVAAVVLDPVHHADLCQHLQVVLGAHPKALGLEQLAGAGQLRQSLAQLHLDRRDRPPHRVLAGHVVSGREHDQLLYLLSRITAQRVVRTDALHLVAEQLDSYGHLLVRGVQLDRVAADAEPAA